MAQIILEVGGRRYDLTVHAGQEERFQRLGSIVDQRARTVVGGMTGVNEARQLLMTALLLADEIGGGTAPTAAPAPDTPSPPQPDPTSEIVRALDALADRIESIAARLERQDTAG